MKRMLVLVAGAVMVAGSAWAVQMHVPYGNALAELNASGANYSWTSADYWTITDLNSAQGTFSLTLENPSASYESGFGLYTLSTDGTAVDKKHEVFGYAQEAGYGLSNPQASVYFKNSGSVWQISNASDGVYSDFDLSFGFYFDVHQQVGSTPNYFLYSDAQFNIDELEHVFIAYDENLHASSIWFEDVLGRNAMTSSDNLDMMVSTDDISPVPEPATMVLLGSGLVGLAGVGRRRKSKKS